MTGRKVIIYLDLNRSVSAYLFDVAVEGDGSEYGVSPQIGREAEFVLYLLSPFRKRHEEYPYENGDEGDINGRVYGVRLDHLYQERMGQQEA